MAHASAFPAAAAPPPKTKRSASTMTILFDEWEVFHQFPKMSDRAFEKFCLVNPNLRIEQDKNGNILIMPPVSYESGNQEMEAGADLVFWNRRTRLGKVFSPSTMFCLPDGAKRMPDAAWISREKDALLSKKERKTFARIVPDFVIEVRSPSDRTPVLKEKMRAVWIANGVRLAWLIDVETQKAWVFRADGSETEVPDFSQKLSGEDVLPGFEMDLQVLL